MTETTPEPGTPEKKLKLNFHGRIIDSLGIQMYQSPVAAVAELIANAWDADAPTVEVSIPTAGDADPKIVVKDTGDGMTFDDCQSCYLNVGRNRRLIDGETSSKGRPLLGRKGIGKFAGFGIARIVQVETVSRKTGERTVFKLDLTKLRSEEFVSSTEKEIEVVVAEGPDPARISSAGTTIELRDLVNDRRPSVPAFSRSMARRFVLAQASSPFRVTVNNEEIPTEVSPLGTSIEFEFPKDYAEGELPEGLSVTPDGWARETVAEGETVEWQVKFTDKPIGEEEFRGTAVYCGVKLAQAPFFFLLSGGLKGQHGQQYLVGRTRADYLDRMGFDVITTERQRINWEDAAAHRLLEWGQGRTKQLLALWQERRAAGKIDAMNKRIAAFSARIDKLKSTEAKTVRRALTRIASIAVIDQEQFEDLAGAILTAWEGGRLRDIIEEVARVESMDAGVLVKLLAEHDVLSALHMAEVVKLKLDVVDGLRKRIDARELENAVRDYIAANPWLISPQWETFQVERRIGKLVADALKESGIAEDVDWNGRVDLVLSSGNQLLILEFMRPDLEVDREHIQRFERYVDILRARIEANSALGLTSVIGLLVADKLHRKSENQKAIERLRKDGMDCLEWAALLGRADAQWKDFLFALAKRSPDDERVKSLLPPEDPKDDGKTSKD